MISDGEGSALLPSDAAFFSSTPALLSATATATRPHAAARTHATTYSRWLFGQGYTTLRSPLFHALMMFLAYLFSFLGSFRIAHFGAIFGVLLLRHQLAAIDLLLLLCFGLFLGLSLVSRQREPYGQRQGSCQGFAVGLLRLHPRRLGSEALRLLQR